MEKRLTAQDSRAPSQIADLRVWRERRAWEAAARHLHARGLPACVPCELVGALRRAGLTVWCQERAA